MLVCTQWLSICLLYALSYKVKIETKNTSLRDVFFVFIIYISSHNFLRLFKDTDYTNIYFKKYVLQRINRQLPQVVRQVSLYRKLNMEFISY
jgi:hypothetical protein